jgi:hypothetical protein
MKKLIKTVSLILVLILPTTSFALDWNDLFNAVLKMYDLDLETNDLSKKQLDQLENLNGALTGKHGYGNKNYDDSAYAWGSGSNSWQDILALSKRGGGNGQLGEVMLSLAKEYPIKNSFESPNQTEKDYYRLQAQTSLASRSAAEVSYQQAVKQEKTMRSLHDLIDKTEDEKSASDLNNRLSSEQAMTSLQQTKLLSILVQQQAVAAQERTNRAKEDMEFFEVK